VAAFDRPARTLKDYGSERLETNPSHPSTAGHGNGRHSGILGPFCANDQALQTRTCRRCQTPLRILDHDALVGLQAIPSNRRQVRVGIWLGVPIVLQGQNEIEILRQPGSGMGNLEVLTTAACHHSHPDSTMEGPKYVLDPFDQARFGSQEFRINPVTLLSKAGDGFSRDALFCRQPERALAMPQRDLDILLGRQVDTDRCENHLGGTEV